MKFNSILFIIFISVNASAQEVALPKVNVEQKKLFIGVNFSPDYCYRNLIKTDNRFIDSLIFDMRNDHEGPKFGYASGINILYKFSRHVAFEGGVQFSNKGFALEDLFFGDQVDPRYGFVYSTSGSSGKISKSKINFNYYYLDVPLRAIFNLGEKKLRLVSSIGITTSFLLNATSTLILKYEDGDTQRDKADMSSQMNEVNIFPTVSAGVSYKISNKLSLNAEPTIRYGLIKISDTPVTEYLWSGGLNVSCYYSIK